MKVSIAMATYNGSEYLQEQLQSFLEQTRLPDELIITDDCSTDNTEEIVGLFSVKAPFPVYFTRNASNLGYCGNFNEALMKTTGDVVFLSDQDDYWFPNKIECALRELNKSPDVMLLINNAELTDGDLKSTGLTKIEQVLSAGLSLDSYVMGCCIVVRRKLLDICMPIPLNYKAHDTWLAGFASGLNSKKVSMQVLQFYRRHSLNESNFIANKTKKVNRLDYAFLAFKRIFNGSQSERDFFTLNQAGIFFDGVRRAAKKFSHDPDIDFSLLLSSSDVKLRDLEKRMKIRTMSLPRRFFAVARYAFSGGYSYHNGFYFIIRDLFG